VFIGAVLAAVCDTNFGSTHGAEQVDFTVNSNPRKFCYLVPAGVDPSKAPVLFYFHGCNGDTSQASAWVEQATLKGYVVVAGKSLDTCWSTTEDNDYTAEVVARVRDLLDVGSVEDAWYAAGFSSGSFYLIDLHCSESNGLSKFRGLGLCGYGGTSSCPGGAPATLVHTNGKLDATGGTYNELLSRLGTYGTLNNCSDVDGELTDTLTGTGGDTDVWTFGSCAKYTVLYGITGMNHDCPNSPSQAPFLRQVVTLDAFMDDFNTTSPLAPGNGGSSSSPASSNFQSLMW